jgi:hypothetical protein
MALAVLVTSPLPADFARQPKWGETVLRYDSGARQASTTYIKPLYTYSINFSNFPRAKQSSLEAFYNDRNGPAEPFLMQDPYDNSSPGGVVVAPNTSPTSFWIVTSRGYPVIAKSGSLRLISTLSGVLTQNTHYVLEQDTGIIVASMRPSSLDTWYVASCEFYKKVAFVSYTENSRFWNMFGGTFVVEEIALP